jgi:hypothetical protein
MKHLPITVVLVAFLAACTSDEAPTPPPAAPAAAKAPAVAPAAKAPAAQGGNPMTMSEQAYKGAMEACKNGCENPSACQQALVQALHATNAALTLPGDDSQLEKNAADAEVLRTRFDGIAKLSQGCVRRAESARKKMQAQPEKPAS